MSSRPSEPSIGRESAALSTNLVEKAEVETTNRKPLREPLQLLPEATWEVRVGPFRVLYRFDDGTVIVLRVILKRGTTEESL